MSLRPTLRIRLAYLSDHSVEAWLGAAALVSGFDFFLTPGRYLRSPLGVAIHPWDYGWNVLYMLGGAVVCLGLVALRPRYEAAGLCLLAAAVTINFVAVASVLGTDGVANETVLLLLVVACGARLWSLVSV